MPTCVSVSQLIKGLKDSWSRWLPLPFGKLLKSICLWQSLRRLRSSCSGHSYNSCLCLTPKYVVQQWCTICQQHATVTIHGLIDDKDWALDGSKRREWERLLYTENGSSPAFPMFGREPVLTCGQRHTPRSSLLSRPSWIRLQTEIINWCWTCITSCVGSQNILTLFPWGGEAQHFMSHSLTAGDIYLDERGGRHT